MQQSLDTAGVESRQVLERPVLLDQVYQCGQIVRRCGANEGLGRAHAKLSLLPRAANVILSVPWQLSSLYTARCTAAGDGTSWCRSSRPKAIVCSPPICPAWERIQPRCPR